MCLSCSYLQLPLFRNVRLGLQAFDGGLQHKWLDFGGANKGATWLEYRLLHSQPAVAVLSYSLTSAEDEPNRDPCDFVLEGSVECPMSSGPSPVPLLLAPFCFLMLLCPCSRCLHLVNTCQHGRVTPATTNQQVQRPINQVVKPSSISLFQTYCEHPGATCPASWLEEGSSSGPG